MSDVTVSMKMSPKAAGRLYMKACELKEENKRLQQIVDGVGEAFGTGGNARTYGVLTTCAQNTRDFTDKLHAIEHEFFMIPGEPDEEFPDEDPDPVCELNSWGTNKEEYVAQFRAALMRKQAEAVRVFAESIGLYDTGYDDQGYIEVSRYSVKEEIERLRDEAEKAGGEHG